MTASSARAACSRSPVPHRRSVPAGPADATVTSFTKTWTALTGRRGCTRSCRQGVSCGKRRVARLMRAAGLEGRFRPSDTVLSRRLHQDVTHVREPLEVNRIRGQKMSAVPYGSGQIAPWRSPVTATALDPKEKRRRLAGILQGR